MKSSDLVQIFIYVIALLALSTLLGVYMAKVFQDKIQFLAKLEALLFKFSGIDPEEDMSWKAYLKALLVFNLMGFLFVFFFQLFQGGVSWHLALNTAVSFMTNTNWQSYAGEVTLTSWTQMLALTPQNFLSAATGIGVFLALVRGLSSKQGTSLGNFWKDLTKSILYILLPLSLIWSILLMSQGVLQNFSSSKEIRTLEGVQQVLPMGPVASQVSIKQLGTNGGGFFNANSAHPFENPTPFSNFLQMLAILLIPAALVITFGILVKAPKQGLVLYMVMLSIWLAGLAGSLYFEGGQGVMEGKETRFGITNSVIWSTATTVASNGSVNAMHSSLSPMAGGIALFNIMMGEVIFGGVGAGLYGMILFVIMTVFLSGLMVGRSPEYLGKKIEAPEMKMALIGILGPCACILLMTAFALKLPIALSSLSTQGPHGLTEMLYAFTSAAGNNGSAFAGLNANTPLLNTLLALAMLIGRFVVIIPVLVIAGQMAPKKRAPVSEGTFQTDNFLFAILLAGVLLIVGALTFLPALSLGPILEQVMNNGR